MLDSFSPPGKDVGSCGEALSHAVEHRLALPASYTSSIITGALRFERAATTSVFVALVDGTMPVLFRPLDRNQIMADRAAVEISCQIVVEFVLGETPLGNGGGALWASNIRRDTEYLSGRACGLR
jgi:hypothetical protein